MPLAIATASLFESVMTVNFAALLLLTTHPLPPSGSTYCIVSFDTTLRFEAVAIFETFFFTTQS
jgi:hypothetical protein